MVVLVNCRLIKRFFAFGQEISLFFFFGHFAASCIIIGNYQFLTVNIGSGEETSFSSIAVRYQLATEPLKTSPL